MKTYLYDLEVFPNFFSATFIDAATNINHVKAYVEADYKGDKKTKMFILSELIKPQIFLVTPTINDLSLFMDFMTTHKTLIGYNNINYDDIIVDFILQNYAYYNKLGKNKKTGKGINEELYDLSYEIINYGAGYRWANTDYKYFKKPYYTKDLQKLLYLDKLYVSLKQVAVQLKWYRLQDLPLPFNAHVSNDDIPKIIDYNINDVLITLELLNTKIDEVNLRESITDMYGVNVRTESRSGTANKLIMNFYTERTGLSYKDIKDERTYRRVIKYEEIISPKIQFSSPELRSFLANLKRKLLMVGTDTLKESVTFDGKTYTFATGGLHSKDFPKIYKSTDSYTIRDADVSSFYPRIILNEEIAPEHLDKEIFLSILEMITDNRLEAKKMTGKLKKIATRDEEVEHYTAVYKNKAEALKIVINALYGKLGDENSFLYDLRAMYSVTINGQLYLLMLVEQLAKQGIKCISANTDGIICLVPKDKEAEYYAACKEWEQHTRFELEYTDYDKYVCYAVNDYIAVKSGYNDSDKSDNAKRNYVKEKGLFVTSIQIDKGYNKPIIAKALVHYFVDGILPENYITSHNDIYDFCASIKTGSDFIKEYHTIKDGQYTIIPLQKNVRYYIANVNGVIMKKYQQVKIDKRGVRREYISLHKGVNSIVFNDFIPNEMKDYNINYNHYIGETYRVIYEINNLNAKKQSRQSYGNLFDELT